MACEKRVKHFIKKNHLTLGPPKLVIVVRKMYFQINLIVMELT